MSTLRRNLRHLRRWAWYAIAIVLVLMALTAGVVSQLLPLAERHPQWVAEWLGERVHRPVHFDRLKTQWTRRGPLLQLEGLRIGDGTETLQIGTAEILVSQYAGLLPGRSFTELRLRGLDLTLQRDDAGRWHVRGLPGERQSTEDPFAPLEGLGELQVIGGKLRVDAPGIGIRTQIPQIDLRLRVDGERVRIGARARMREDTTSAGGTSAGGTSAGGTSAGSTFETRSDFNRRSGDGRSYLIAEDTDLSAWTSLLHFAGVGVARGSGRIEVWADLSKHRVTGVTVESELTDLRLQGAAIAGRTVVPFLDFERLEVAGRARMDADGWRFDASRLRLGSKREPQTLDGLVVAGGKRFALLADRINASPLFALAALSDRLDPGTRTWLLDSKPETLLHGIEVAGRLDGPMHVRGRIENLRFAAHGTTPGISGLSGTLDGDGDGFSFAFDPAATFRFDWPPGFGAPHDVHLQGSVAGWREGTGWKVETGALRIDGVGYGADVRGGLWFQGDGTKPYIDLAAKLDDIAVPVAKRFWVRHRMSVNTVHWLDNGLVGGHVQDGRAVVSGDLDDWPFRSESGQAAKGLFEADAHLAGAIVKFQPEWPQVDHLDGEVNFVADGFTVKGKGAIAGVPITKLEAGIPHFDKAELAVRADIAGDAGAALTLMRQSPLHKRIGETLDNLTASGPIASQFALDIPLHRGAPDPYVPRIAGTVVLDGAKLGEKRWKLAFEDVRGTAKYDEKGFDAERMRALHEGSPGTLSLRTGPGHVRDASQAFEAELNTVSDADALLDRVSDMAWLKPHVDGRSMWTVGVTIPKTPASASAVSPPTLLQLRSDLVGTRFALPAPLNKPASVALPTKIETPLPLGEGDISVAFGQRMALRARTANGRTGIRIALGSHQVTEAPPASGLVVSGRTPTLDAIDWAALTMGGEGKGLSLQRVDVNADRLNLVGGSFANARLTASPATGGTAVQVDSASLAGTVTLPRAEGAAIVGKFDRLYWTTAKPDTKPSTTTAANAAATPPAEDTNTINPANIPPLQLSVDDLRFGEAQLGQATLRTRPVPAGLRIEQLQTRASKQQVDASGDWLGRGAGARTRLKVDVKSGDFGALLAGFGFGGRLAGGHGDAHLDAAWPGAPGGFKVAALEGSLSLMIKDGQLVQVEPGAGRVLGLLSVAQLPRRLMLDFRDFFSKGFAFNRIGGGVSFGAGQARSNDMKIEGPAANIQISGAADLRSQTFDQTIEVQPKSGNLLTVAGALVGGPVGAAVGAAANAVLGKPLGAVSAKTYRVTGPWKDPKVEVASSKSAPAVDKR
ncbi:YhdP family protein [Luteimonas panaciterrae]|uniref:YhdP family protein n=1 Tax=Luteimonas panaciterrae TaxID=363885 RepID=UPI001CF9D8FC|nr:YhdP family protein [Luteimonas panaciterrae]